jgi:hypothetical protein
LKSAFFTFFLSKKAQISCQLLAEIFRSKDLKELDLVSVQKDESQIDFLTMAFPREYDVSLSLQRVESSQIVLFDLTKWDIHRYKEGDR